MKIYFINEHPRITPHEEKWSGCGDPDRWIDCQEESRERLRQQTAGMTREDAIKHLRASGFRFYERESGDLVVSLLVGDYSGEHAMIASLTAHLEKAIGRAAKRFRSEVTYPKPSEKTVREMAKAAVAVYVAGERYPTCDDWGTDAEPGIVHRHKDGDSEPC